MRITYSLLSGLALTAVAVANNAFLFTFDTDVQARSSDPAIVSSTQGLSILARRRGTTDTALLGDASQHEIELLNELGGYQQSMFDWRGQRPVAKVFLQIKGHDRGMTKSSAKYT